MFSSASAQTPSLVTARWNVATKKSLISFKYFCHINKQIRTRGVGVETPDLACISNIP